MPKNEAVKAWAKKMVPRTEADAAHREAASPLPGFDKKKKPKKESKWASMKDPETSFYRLGQKALRSKPKGWEERSAMMKELEAASDKARLWLSKQLDKKHPKYTSGHGNAEEKRRWRKDLKASYKRRADLMEKINAHFNKLSDREHREWVTRHRKGTLLEKSPRGRR